MSGNIEDNELSQIILSNFGHTVDWKISDKDKTEK